ncbi:hypothetical protein PE067_12490 [Paracoccus sp. DMF-8]|uniref:hypothetical protein n=1 Tax=Paracoccus sp. DMF-8 TaxID=3019445 RepID=UPI0023E8D9C3|nr:hypothetical protein [Paracoccus sp. DMF-8]MDF3606874.1 hypothetical protein [Paracoccus sp. DMF-8]
MMPRNPLVIGNSHTAAVRIALRDGPGRWPGFDPDIFAMPGGTLFRLELRDRAFVPTDAETKKQMVFYNGVPELPLSGYDGFVVLGGISFKQIAELQATHRSGDFPSVRAGKACRLVSTGFVDAMMQRRIADSSALRVMRALHGLGQGPVVFMDTVFPSAEAHVGAKGFRTYVEMVARGDGAAFHARYIDLLDREIGDAAIRLPQPAETVVDGLFTAPEWMRGSIRLNPHDDVPHDADDYGHANASYGALQVDAVIRAFAAL